MSCLPYPQGCRPNAQALSKSPEASLCCQQAYQEMFGRINPKGCQRNKVVIDFQVTKKINDFSLNKGRDQMESQTKQKTQTNGCQTMESITDKIKEPSLIETKAQSSETKVQENLGRE